MVSVCTMYASNGQKNERRAEVNFLPRYILCVCVSANAIDAFRLLFLKLYENDAGRRVFRFYSAYNKIKELIQLIILIKSNGFFRLSFEWNYYFDFDLCVKRREENPSIKRKCKR